MSSAEVTAAREQLISQVLRLLAAERDAPHAHWGAEAEYAKELVALAARNLAELTDALPEDQRPVGWIRPYPADLKEGVWATVTLRNVRVCSDVFDDDGQPFVTVGHDALVEPVDLALTGDVAVSFLVTEHERAAQARATLGGEA